MCSFFMRTAKTLIRLGGCPGSSESSLGVQVGLSVLCGGTFGIAKPYHCREITLGLNSQVYYNEMRSQVHRYLRICLHGNSAVYTLPSNRTICASISRHENQFYGCLATTELLHKDAYFYC